LRTTTAGASRTLITRSSASTYLESAAVSADLEGAVLAEVERLDDDGRPVTLGRYLLEVLLSDISERQRVPIVRTVVARENARSLRLSGSRPASHHRRPARSADRRSSRDPEAVAPGER
jgi:hypothetical protein